MASQEISKDVIPQVQAAKVTTSGGGSKDNDDAVVVETSAQWRALLRAQRFDATANHTLGRIRQLDTAVKVGVTDFLSLLRNQISRQPSTETTDDYDSTGRGAEMITLLNKTHHQYTPVETTDKEADAAMIRVDTTASSPDAFGVKKQALPVWGYVMELAANIFNYEPSNIRGKQARLTMWEALEMFDFLSDAFFIARVIQTSWIEGRSISAVDGRGMSYVGYTTAICLSSIYVISIAAYVTRRYNMYHRIISPHTRLFYPIVCFKEIKTLGDTHPIYLYMFERLVWTYQFSVRIFEDIPQLVVSTIFMATYGRTFHTYFIIAYSLFMMLITSYRMGVMFPFFGTLSLMLSRRPPIDEPDIQEAAHTTRAFALFMSFNFFCWTVAHLACAKVCGRRLSAKVFLGLSGLCGTLCGICLVSWGHLVSQAWSAPLDGTEEPLYDNSCGTSVIDPGEEAAPANVNLLKHTFVGS